MSTKSTLWIYVRYGQSVLAVISLFLTTAVAGCGVSGAYECDESMAAGPEVPLARDTLAVAAHPGWTGAIGVNDTTRADGSSVVEIEWQPAYTITNLTKDEVCVQDVRVDFPELQDSAGRLLALNNTGGLRPVDIYNDWTVVNDGPTVTKQPPFELDPGTTVLARFHQYFTLTLDNDPVPLTVDEDLAGLLGPLFGLNRFPDGSYQCASDYGLRTVVESNLGELIIKTTNVIMPVGCKLRISPP